MITISTSGSAVVFEFDDNQHYLQSGTIEVPINSLTLVTDDSEMFTFRKAATNDIFVSGLYSEIGMTKDELIAYYKANMVGSTGGGSGSGLTPEQAQEMIDDSISGKADTSAVTASIAAAVSGKADTSAVTEAISEAISGKADTSAVTASIAAAVSGKADTSALTAVDNVLTAHTANTNIHVTTAQTAAWDAKQAQLTAGSGITIDSNNTISCTVTGGGNNVVEVTQAVYDALVSAGTVDLTALYVITDATEIDISNYYTSAQTNSAINAAVSGKQDTLSAGTNITISGNVISATGGGKAIAAGRGISVTTGSTADTVSLSLPISAGTGSGSIIIGETLSPGGNNNGKDSLNVGSRNSVNSQTDCSLVVGYGCSVNGDGAAVIGWSSQANGDHAFAVGSDCNASGKSSVAIGTMIKTSQQNEVSFGKYNVSHTGSTDANKTLFSVGNGTANGARHNALEIRQNGDIYCSNGTSDVKLQDYLQVKVVQISQSDYDQLQNKDANTLYLITNS